MSAATTIEAAADDVFAVLADPSRHAGIDGTGWVTLTDDWSAVGPGPRAYLTLPVFPDGHLERSLDHLAQMLTSPR
ncbi:hypothetical protein [Solicola sp. PLA-1-18]|uniref:hypothetical protein n=1 Tax=Solicola sp. PLA-1-18 TaxID=3380532 RepID=UPI003B7BB57B